MEELLKQLSEQGETITSSQLDWISVTIPHNHEYKLPPFLNGIAWKESKGRHGYMSARQFINGVQEYNTPSKENMGVHLVYSGKALEHINSWSTMENEPLNYHFRMGHKFTRIDYAYDIIGEPIGLKHLVSMYESGKVTTRLRSKPTSIVKGMSQYETVYFGSLKKRTKLLRAYRKDIEQGLDGYGARWLRLELETRGKSANQSLTPLMEDLDLHTGIAGMIRGFIDFHSPTWVEQLESKPMKIPKTADKKGNTAKWLLEQCAPALAKQILLDERFLDVFRDVVNEKIKELRGTQ